MRTPVPKPNAARIARWRDHNHCGRAGCRCTHSDGCDHGWIDGLSYTDPVTLQTYRPVEPCPVCRPEYAERLMKGSTNV